MFMQSNANLTQSTLLPRKILFVLDLDEAHFDSYASLGRDPWIHNKNIWINHYKKMIEIAKTNDIEIIIAIVTRKSGIDDICIEAANAFKEFLPNEMYQKNNDKDCCIVNAN